MKLGVCYYPEQWPDSMWGPDLTAMHDLGLTYVRIGEFAWSRIECEPNHLTWDWLDRVLELVAHNELKAVLGTPTATPPQWLVQAHAEILPQTPQGQVRKFGSRRHTCFTSPVWHQQAARIVRLMAERYGQHAAVAGWQTDNEYGCHDTVRCACPACVAGFQQWLRTRYKTIDNLNAAWGTSFWSQTYLRFDTIDLPLGTVAEANPAHRLDYYRFASDQVVRFNRVQADILRAASPDRFITHNYMGFFYHFDHYETTYDLDFASWDSYPLGSIEQSPLPDDVKARYARTGYPDISAFHHDLYRGMARKPFWVMEQQPGPVNWGDYNPSPAPGMVRLWTWEALAHGAGVVSYFRWRQARFGQEQMHSGLRRPDDRPDIGHGEAAAVLQEAFALPDTMRSPIALVMDYEASWVFDIQPQGVSFVYRELLLTWYTAARVLGLDVDIVPPTADLSEWRLVLVPSLPILKGPMTGPDTIILGPRTGSKTVDFQVPADLPPNGLLPIRVSRVESLRPNVIESVTWSSSEPGGDSRIYDVCRWRETIETELPVLARFGNGEAAVVRSNPFVYFGFWPSQAMLTDFIEAECTALDIPTVRLPPDVRLRRRGNLQFAFNFGDEPIASPVAATAYRLGDAMLQPHGVSAWTV